MKIKILVSLIACLLGTMNVHAGPYHSKETCEKSCRSACYYHSEPTGPKMNDPFRVDIGIHMMPGWYCQQIN